MPHRILVADDDPHIREVICFALERAGLLTTTAAEGKGALEAFAREKPDLVVLDVGMPELDGLDVCRELRRHSTVPILFLSARDEEIDRVLGLELGGDDYVCKPFSPRELVARVNTILRRAGGARTAAGEDAEGRELRHGLLALDSARRNVSFDARDVALTSTEFAILHRLIVRPAHVLSREQLTEASHAANIHVSDRTVDSHIRNIRAKFAAIGAADVVETVHGVGFRLGRCGG